MLQSARGMEILYWITLSLTGGLFILGSLASLMEKEYRAMKLLLLAAFLLMLIYFVPMVFLNDPALYMWIILLVMASTIIAFHLPVSGLSRRNSSPPSTRFDESDAVLSRRLLQPGTDAYENYYKNHPEFKPADDRARENPGLLSPESAYYDPVTFASAEAGFILTEHLHSLEKIHPSGKKQPLDPSKMKVFIADWLLRSGAHQVGFTSLEDHHLYSRKGRGERKDEPIINDLPHAIAITVEMNHQVMQYAPAGPTVMESSDQYLASGILAGKLAMMIKKLGDNARAQTDGNFEVICPLVAADAGLGVIGRMGLLMVPRLGPRVRIAIVTTDLPLAYEQQKAHPAALDFCRKCKKCASVCPSNAIPFGPMQEMEGSFRWRINSERCYHYWTVSGTDCGRCVIHCPFSHPDNWFHRYIRWGVKNNLLFRRMAAKLDDVFYGQKPQIKRLPDRFIFSKQ